MAAGEPVMGLVFAVRGRARASGEEHEEAFLLSSLYVSPTFALTLVLVLLLPPSEPLASQNTWPGSTGDSALPIDLHCGIVGQCERLVELEGGRATTPKHH